VASEGFERAYRRVLEAYVPRRYPGPVTVLVPADERAQQGDSGWSRVAVRTTLREVPGDHLTCLTRHVDGLGAVLRECLDAAQRR
jgi:hypothetical protein